MQGVRCWLLQSQGIQFVDSKRPVRIPYEVSSRLLYKDGWHSGGTAQLRCLRRWLFQSL